jgi:heat shock protein HslJ
MAHVNTAANKEWKLTTLLDKQIDVVRPPTMMFAKGRLNIFGGVNRLSGSYALIRDSVTLGELISTKMAGPPELMELERLFATTLAGVDGFHVHENQLALLSKGQVVATFLAGE